MEEIKVNDYVRTKNGYIEKVTETDNNYVYSDGILSYQFQGDVEIPNSYEEKSKIVKHSPNIIDLMQVKDVIEYIEQTEGREGTKVGETYITDIHSENELNEIKKEIQENGIKLLSITTKEQINQVKYEV